MAHDLSAHAHHEREEQFNKSGEKRTLAVVGLALVMMIGEVIVGRMTGSLALEGDGWHMGTHVGALGLTLVAYWYARTRAAHDSFSFGTGKVYALAGFTSGVVLALVAIWMGKEGIERLIDDHHPDFDQALPVAVLGLVVNGASALILGTGHHYGHSHGHGDHEHDHRAHQHKPQAGTIDFNMRAAYIHILADALTSLLAIGALALGAWNESLGFLDPTVGLVAGVVILVWAVGLCRQASRQLLDVVSSPVHEQVVRQKLEEIDDVRVADLHVWELGPGRRSCIVSLVTARPREVDVYRKAVLGALDVAHLTIEVHGCDLHSEPKIDVPPHLHHHGHGHGHDHDH
jgi:cation diffusion facilitator family transporter